MQIPEQLDATFKNPDAKQNNPVLSEDNQALGSRSHLLKQAAKTISLELIVILLIVAVLLFGLNYLNIIKLESISTTFSQLPKVSSKTIHPEKITTTGLVEKKNKVIPESRKISDLKPGQYLMQVNSDKTRAIVIYPEVSQQGRLAGIAYSVLPSCDECNGFDKISKAFFHPKTGELFLFAIKNGDFYVKHGTNELGPYQSVAINKMTIYTDGTVKPILESPIRNIAFDSKSGHFAYSIISNGKHSVYKDGVLVESYDLAASLSDLMFSPDGSKFVYSVFYREDKGGRSFSVLNGKKGKEYSGKISGLEFTSDSKHFMFIADKPVVGKPTEKTVVVDENTYHAGYDVLYLGWGLGDQIMTNDHGDYAYVLLNPFGDYRLIVNNKIVATAFQIENFLFSPDGKRFAYVTIDKASFGKESVYLDGKKIFEIPARHNMGVTHLKFSTDSKRLYFTVDGKQLMQDGTIFLKEETRGNIVDYARSLDQKRLIYKYFDTNAKKYKANVDGTDYDLLGRDLPVFFSPDSKHFVLWTSSNETTPISERVNYDGPYSFGEAQLIVDGVVRPTQFENLQNSLIEGDTGFTNYYLEISDDSDYVSFVGKKGNELWYVVEKL